MASTSVASAAVIVAAGLAALLTAGHRDQGEQIRELTRQLSDLQAERADDARAGAPLPLPRGRALQASGGALPFTLASDYGVVGDSMADDGPALQAAIDAASAGDSGGIVLLPPGVFLTLQPLVVPGGVTLQGMGYGSSPLAIQFDAGGTTIAYCGTDYAVKMVGHDASLRDLAVYDWPYEHGPHDSGCEATQAAGGVVVRADGKLVESVNLSNVFIYYFLGGAALSLIATNNAGIGYSNFQNVRLRHAKTGVKLYADDIGTGSNGGKSFVNTNSFLGGSISGGGFDYGIHATGPGDCNDNKFYGMSIGMSDSEVAHVYVTGSTTNVRLNDIRLEADSKSLDRPIVIVDDSSYGNVMNGILGHTHIQANLNRNPGIDFLSQKSVGLDPAPANMFWNDGFNGYDEANRKMPGWTLGGTNAIITILDDAEYLYPGHHAIHVDKLSYGGPFKLMADETLLVPGHDFVTFGVFARSSVAGSISAAMRYTSGSITSSGSHSGSGQWEFIGMTGLYDKTAPYFYFSITGDVDLTAPTLTFGQAPARPGASFLSSSGARMSGTFTQGMAVGLPPAPEANQYYWVLPKTEGNVFVIDVHGNPIRTIIRLNHSGADRFPRGTVITLMFEEAGTRVKHSAYIKLKNNQDFVSVPNSSITLVTKGSASWYEVSRNA